MTSNAKLDSTYLHTNGNANLPDHVNANGEQMPIAASSMIRSHSVSDDLHGVQPDPIAADILRKEPEHETFSMQSNYLRIASYQKKIRLVLGEKCSSYILQATSAKLVSQILGFQAIEVNASDNGGQDDAKVEKGIGGSTSNSIKELVNNEALSVNMD
ncbi:unnamed protein product [Ilex paraguariensis]|uniref:Uncharacterized protein n=1 Tax=Ilex paraguariensis TaxID=185542 RepID=A0ABC8RNW0_9AQUA